MGFLLYSKGLKEEHWEVDSLIYNTTNVCCNKLTSNVFPIQV